MAEIFFLQGLVEPRQLGNTAILNNESRRRALTEDGNSRVTDANVADVGISNGEFQYTWPSISTAF